MNKEQVTSGLVYLKDRVSNRSLNDQSSQLWAGNLSSKGVDIYEEHKPTKKHRFDEVMTRFFQKINYRYHVLLRTEGFDLRLKIILIELLNIRV